MSKTRKIQRMLAKGLDATQIAKKLGVKNAFVHTVKWQMKRDAKTPLKKATSESRRKVFNITMPKIEAEVRDVKAAMDFLDAEKLIVEPIDMTSAISALRAKVAQQDKDWLDRDSVNHPPHYTAGGIETIDFIEAKDLNYRLGNVIKYVSRAEKKENPLEDLKKAKWYLEREIATRERA